MTSVYEVSLACPKWNVWPSDTYIKFSEEIRAGKRWESYQQRGGWYPPEWMTSLTRLIEVSSFFQTYTKAKTCERDYEQEVNIIWGRKKYIEKEKEVERQRKDGPRSTIVYAYHYFCTNTFSRLTAWLLACMVTSSSQTDHFRNNLQCCGLFLSWPTKNMLWTTMFIEIQQTFTTASAKSKGRGRHHPLLLPKRETQKRAAWHIQKCTFNLVICYYLKASVLKIASGPPVTTPLFSGWRDHWE